MIAQYDFMQDVLLILGHESARKYVNHVNHVYPTCLF